MNQQGLAGPYEYFYPQGICPTAEKRNKAKAMQTICNGLGNEPKCFLLPIMRRNTVNPSFQGSCLWKRQTGPEAVLFWVRFSK